MTYPATPTTSPARHEDRMCRERETVHAILDEALYCHVSYVVDGQPKLLPTVHVRIGETVYLHGSTGSTAALVARDGGLDVCLAATLADGLVFARTQPHHSIQYRSVIAHGPVTLVTDDETKLAVSAALVDKMARGRSAETRAPNRKDLAKVAILALPLDQVAAKVRPSGVADDPEDLDLPYWAGVLPLRTVAGEPEPDAGVDRPIPGYLAGWQRGPQPDRSAWRTAEPMAGSLVRLEPVSLDHLDDLWEAGRDPEIFRWQYAQPESRDDMARLVLTALRQYADGSRVTWAQIDTATGRAVGMTSYWDIDEGHRHLEIGHTWLGSPWWRSGINTEAKLLLMRRAFDTLGALRVCWRTDIRNQRSQQAIQRLGAKWEGVLRNHRIRPDGTLRDSVVFGMTVDEWPVARDRLTARLAVGAAA